LRQLERALAQEVHRVSAATIAVLLKAEGYSLQGNAKVLEGTSAPDRDEQFAHINAKAGEFLAAGDPVISVDTKKKEDIGLFARPGKHWRPAGIPVRTLDHDFAGQAVGKAISYGIYNVGANTGFVVVGTDHDTAAFAVNAIRTWWNTQGRAAYPDATRLLVTADGGGSNGSRVRAWKAELAYLAAETGLTIHVCHFPPGTSKWNKVEHRLFSFISMNWAATPLTSYEVAINLIAATTTTTGLTVTALLDTARYPTGIEIGEDHLKALTIVRDPERGRWNYTLPPNPATPPPPRQPPPGKDTNAPPPPRPRTEYETFTRSHPALTGIPRADLDALVDALAQLHTLPDTPPRRGGRQPLLSFEEQVWATLAYRHSMTGPMTARHFDISKETLKRVAATIDPLLARHGHTVTRTPRRLRHPIQVAHAVMTTTSTPD
jgi:hypothetical protein